MANLGSKCDELPKLQQNSFCCFTGLSDLESNMLKVGQNRHTASGLICYRWSNKGYTYLLKPRCEVNDYESSKAGNGATTECDWLQKIP